MKDSTPDNTMQAQRSRLNYKRSAAIWEHSKASGGTLLLLLAIAKHADDNGAAWPGNKMLAQMLRQTPRAVIKHVQAAEQLGELIVYRRKGKPNGYILDVGLTDEQRAAARERLVIKFPDLREVVNGRSPVPVNRRSPVRKLEVVNKCASSGERAFTSTSEQAFTRSTYRRDQEEKDHALASASASATGPVEGCEEPPPPQPSPQQVMFEAICRAWGYAPADVTDTLRGLIGKAAKELVRVRAAPEDILELKGWLDLRARHDGWKSYTVAAMTKYWPDFVAARAAGHRPAEHPPYTLDEMMYKARMFNRLMSEGRKDEALALNYHAVIRAMEDAGAPRQ